MTCVKTDIKEDGDGLTRKEDAQSMIQPIGWWISADDVVAELGRRWARRRQERKDRGKDEDITRFWRESRFDDVVAKEHMNIREDGIIL